MKAFIYSLITTVSLVSSALAQGDKIIEATLVSTTITELSTKDIPYKERPFHLTEGASLVFYFKLENLVSIDKDSFNAKDWDKHCNTNISQDGQAGSITIQNRKFKGIYEEIEVEAMIDVLVGTKKETKTFKLKKGADPVEFPQFTAELQLKNQGDNDIGHAGVKVLGNHSTIKSIELIRDGKEIKSNGYSSSNDWKTFSFRDIKDGDEVRIVYWTGLKNRTVKLYK